jgi:HD-like signal output (HDOD) protein
MAITSGLDENLTQQLLDVKLPSLPAIVVQLIGLGRSASSNVDRLTAIISQDPAITVALIRLANAALYHRAEPAETLLEATSRLGYERSRVIAISATVLPALRSIHAPGLPYEAYWRRSLIAGVAARSIGQRLRPDDVESIFLAAMLQDIGILALAQLPVGIYRDIPSGTYTHEAAIECERELIKEDHGAVGARLLEEWDFPARFIRAVRLSNVPGITPFTPDLRDLAGLVRASGLLADLWLRAGTHPELTSYRAEIGRLLGMEWQTVVELVADASSEIPQVEALCGVQIPNVEDMRLALLILREPSESESPSE